MSTDQKIFTNALEELANDLHAQQQLQIEDLKAEHKKKEAALLEKIQTAETRYQELESKYQKDVNSLKTKFSDPFEYDAFPEFDMDFFQI